MRVMLVDGHQLVREVFARVLTGPDIEIVAQAGTGDEAVALARQVRPDVLLITVRLPGLSGIEATRALLREFPQLCVIGMTTVENEVEARSICEAGAIACVSKSGPLSDFLAAIGWCRERADAFKPASGCPGGRVTQ